MFVVVLVGGILAAQLAVWSSVLVWFSRRRRVIANRLDSGLAAETIIRSPEAASYRGATVAGYPIVNNDGIIALTRQRLVFQALTGKVIEVPVTDIAGVREAEVFKSAMKAGRQHLIIRTSSGEIGFYVTDNAAWIASLATVGAQSIAVGGSSADSLGEPGVDLPDSVRARRTTMAILAVVFTSIGLLLALGTGISAAVVADTVSGARSADGTVVDFFYTGKSYRPVVEFVPPGSAPVRFTGWVGSDPPAFRVGEHVGVRYNPDDPHDATIDQYWQTWFVTTLLGILSAPFLLIGIGFGVVTLAARRRVRP